MDQASRITIAIVTGAMVAIVVIASPVPAPGRPDRTRGTGPCDLPRRTGESVHDHMKRFIWCAAGKWPIRGGYTMALCVAKRESGLDPKASSTTGEYLGLYQHLATAWPSRFDRWTKRRWDLKDDALNGRSNAVVTMRMVHADGWGPWKGPGC
jgi:hypothetical protein